MNTDKHKLALEICGYKCKDKSEHCHINCKTYWCLVKMEQWKNEQIAQEKQQWIDKLEDWLDNNICNAYNFRGDDISSTFINDCIKAMKGE